MEETSANKTNNFAFAIKAAGIALCALLLFTGLFKIFQNPEIYSKTLSKISHNYERTGTWDNYQITDVEKPYVEITNDNVLNWDASIYNCIRERMYSQDEAKCFHLVRPAFFPLFPLVWKFSTLDAIGVSVLNYFVFAFSLIWLVNIFITDKSQKLYYYAFGLLLPSVIIFGIPYSEAIFLLAFTVLAAGFLQKKYVIYFIGMFLLAASRPAAFFVPLAMLAAYVPYIISRKNAFSQYVKDWFSLFLPYMLGLIAVAMLQYYYTGSWTALLDAQKHWGAKFSIPKQISDWSIEGFGLSVFALIFVVLPLVIYIISIFIQKGKKDDVAGISMFKETLPVKYNFLFLTAAFYTLGIFVYTLFIGGGSLHSFFRFVLASPAFYVMLFLLPEKISHISISKKMLWFAGLLLIVIAFLMTIEYGGPRFKFSFFGLYLFICFAALYIFGNKVSTSLRYLALFGLGIFSILWATYLFNMLLTNAWIFT